YTGALAAFKLWGYCGLARLRKAAKLNPFVLVTILAQVSQSRKLPGKPTIISSLLDSLLHSHREPNALAGATGPINGSEEAHDHL
ncbi:hypothetical protein WOLCODRAFT_70909, partial [Wolfiporia cocos MD-104 SS10]